MATLKIANIHFDAAGTTLIRANGANTLTFNTADAEDVRIDATGNVLIGRIDSTVGQGVKLDVAGAINASSFLVNGSAVGGGNYAMQVFTTPGPSTWTKPAGLKAVKVTVVGGGGGNAPAPSPPTNPSSTYSSGGGGTSIEYIPAPSIPGPVAVTVGAGGSTPAPTRTGGTSSFGTFLSATGGAFGVTAAGGGSGTGGDINVTGGAGDEQGGSTLLGFGGVGGAGQSYGGGAGGRTQIGPQFGSPGGPGIVVVEEFY